MKRDPEVIRNILIHLEENSDGMSCEFPIFEGVESHVIHYHARLLFDGGFIKAINADSNAGMYCHPTSLNLKGHDLVETLRNDTLWNGFKEKIQKHGLPIAFGILESTLKQMIIGLG